MGGTSSSWLFTSTTPGTVRATSRGPLERRRPLEADHPAVGVDAQTVLARVGVRRQRGAHARGERPVAHLLPRLRGRGEAPDEPGDRLDARVHRELLGVEDEVVQRRIAPVDVVEIPDAPVLLLVAAAHHLHRRADVHALLRLAGHLLHDALDPELEGRDHEDAQDVRDAAQQHLAAPRVDDDVVLLRHVQEGGLEDGDVLPGLDVEPLEERGLLLVELGQLVLAHPVALGRLGEHVPVHVAPPEPLGQLDPDLGATRPRLVRDRHDGHWGTSRPVRTGLNPLPRARSLPSVPHSGGSALGGRPRAECSRSVGSDTPVPHAASGESRA